MQVISFTSSRRYIRTLLEIEPQYLKHSLLDETFKKSYEKKLALSILDFLEESLYPREEKVEFLKNLRKEMKNFKFDSPYVLYTENSYPYSYYFDRENGRIVPKENVIGIPLKNSEFVPKTSRDLGSRINSGLDILSKIINSYQKGNKPLNSITTIVLVTPICVIPYNCRNLKPMIEVEPFFIPDVTSYKVVQHYAWISRLCAELMGKKPPKDSDLSSEAFTFSYDGKNKSITWGVVEKTCGKILLRDFENLAEDFILKNLNQKAILYLSSKGYLKKFREILNKHNLYDKNLDVTKEFLKNNAGDKEYLAWGLGASKLIGKYVIDSRGIRRFHAGKLERVIREEIGAKKYEVVYNSSLFDTPVKDRKLQRFFEIWFGRDFNKSKVYARPRKCEKTENFFDFNDEELCSSEKYLEWKEKQNEESVKIFEEFVRKTNPIQQWTGIAQLIQERIEKEIYPLELKKEEIGPYDYSFSQFNRTPVENALIDSGLAKGIEEEEITKWGMKYKLKEIAEIGRLMHDARRFCTVSEHDFNKFTEVPLSLKIGNYMYGDFKIAGIADFCGETEDHKCHVCDTKMEALFSPSLGQRYQVIAAGLAIQQKYNIPFDSGSNYYHTSVLREGILFTYSYDSSKIANIVNDMIEQIYDYKQMMDNPNSVPKYFEKYKRRMSEERQEKMRKIIEEKLGLQVKL